MRETGYYWVKLNRWVIAYWLVYEDHTGDCWQLGQRVLFDADFTEINETRIKNPGEK